MPEWLNPQEAAAYLKIDRRTLLEWARRGQVKGYKLSGTRRHVWRFLAEELDAAVVTASSARNVLASTLSSVAR